MMNNFFPLSFLADELGGERGMWEKEEVMKTWLMLRLDIPNGWRMRGETMKEVTQRFVYFEPDPFPRPSQHLSPF